MRRSPTLLVLVALAAAGCHQVQYVKLEVKDRKGRAFSTAIDRPTVIVPRMAVHDGSWRDAEVYGARIDSTLPQVVQEGLERLTRSTALFADVETVEWSVTELDERRAGLRPTDLVLAMEMQRFQVSGGPNPGAYIAGICTLGILPLLAVAGIPTLSYHQESEWRLVYRLVSAGTGSVLHEWDSEPIRTNDANFSASWTNTPAKLEAMLDEQTRRLYVAYVSSFEPMSGGKQLDVEYPYEVISDRVDLRVNVAPDPALQMVEIDVNEERVLERDRRVDANPTFYVTVDLERGTNEVRVAVRSPKGEVVTRIDLTITRLK